MTIACPKCGYKLHQFDMTPFKILELVVAFDWRTLNEDETIRYKPVFGNIPMDGARALEKSYGDSLFIINNLTLYCFESGTTFSHCKWVLFHVANEESV